MPTVDPGLVRKGSSTVAAEPMVAADRTEGLAVRLANPKSRIFGLVAAGHENVGRFDVAVDDSLGMGGVESVGDLGAEIEQLLRLHRLIVDSVLKGFAFQQLHGNEVAPAVFGNLVNGADIGVVQR